MNAGEFDPFDSASACPRRRSVLVWTVAVLFQVPAHAIDNPDSPDRTAEFLARAQPFERRLADESLGPTSAAAYASFLDVELNQAYRDVLERVSGEARQSLVRSQREWLRFRDAESQFIGNNWVPKNFGSSSALSRAGYRSALVKQRVLTLLAYLQNYPAGVR